MQSLQFIRSTKPAAAWKSAARSTRLTLDSPDTQAVPSKAHSAQKRCSSRTTESTFSGRRSNVFNGCVSTPAATDGKLLMFAPATAAHPNWQARLRLSLRPVVFDTAPEGLAPTWLKCFAAAKKVAILMQNDAFGRFAVDIYKDSFAKAGIEIQTHWFEASTKDYFGRAGAHRRMEAGLPFPWSYTDAAFTISCSRPHSSGSPNSGWCAAPRPRYQKQGLDRRVHRLHAQVLRRGRETDPKGRSSHGDYKDSSRSRISVRPGPASANGLP